MARRLRTTGIRACRPQMQILTAEHRRWRLKWAPTVRRWQCRDWQSVVITDDIRFCLYRADGRQSVFRRRGEPMEVVPFGGGRVMVWGGKLTTQRHIDDIRRHGVLPFLKQQPHGVLYQRDNARPERQRLALASTLT